MKRKVNMRFAGPGTALTVVSIGLGADGVPPKEFRVFRKGENRSEKGTFFFDDSSAEAVMSAFVEHNKPLHLDYNHGTLLEAPPTPEASLSAGTWVPEVRDGELWATKVSWTPRAYKLVGDREYGEISPYFNHTAAGVITRVVNCALTNLPALDDLDSLVAANAHHPHREEAMSCESCSALTARLNTMDEECKSLKARLSLFEKKDEDEKTKATALTALTGKTAHPETLGVIQGWKVKAEAHDVLAAKMAEHEAKAAEQAATALTAGIKAGLDKLSENGQLEPAKRGEFEAIALKLGAGKPSKEGVDFLTSLAATLPKKVSTSDRDQAVAGAEGEVKLTAHEEETAKKHGIDLKVALTAKKNIAAQKAARSVSA